MRGWLRGCTLMGCGLRFARPHTHSHCACVWMQMQVSGGRGLHKLRGKGMNTMSFTPLAATGSRLSLNSSLSNKQNWGLGSLKRNNARASAVGHGPKKALVTIDNNHIVRVVNQRACELFGYESADLIGVGLSSLLPTPVYAPEKVRFANVIACPLAVACSFHPHSLLLPTVHCKGCVGYVGGR